MELSVVKLLILIALFIATYVFALLPIPLMRAASSTNDIRRRRKMDRCISFLSCFAAGVFLGTCLLDLYPEVEQTLVEAVGKYISKDNKYKDYPFGESVMVVGFFLVLIVEQIVLAIKEKNEPQELVESGSTSIRDSSRSNPNPGTYGSTANRDETQRLLGESLEPEYRPRSASMSSARSINAVSDRPSTSTSSNGQYDQSMHQDPNSHSPIRSFIMLAALSLHSVFEGLAVGLQSTVADVLSIFGALILHKCIIAFSIGLNLVQSKLTFKAIVGSNAVFCIASPIGIAIGILIDEYSESSDTKMVSGILQGLACGTFLYVTFFEVLPHEFNKPSDRILKLLFVILGFAFVNGVLFLEMHLTYKPSNGG